MSETSVNTANLIQLTVEVSGPAEEAVAELLGRVFGRAPSIYVDAESGRVSASLYFRSSRECSEQKRAQVKAGLEWIGQCGLETGPGLIKLAKVEREDWAESWKRHFPVLEIGSALMVKPTWSRRRPGRNQAVVELDPGLSFGTGHHPTTQFCLEQIVLGRPCGLDSPRSFLDMGTGSGILSIAAVKLGYEPVEAFDFDPCAVRVAKENGRRNGVERKLNVVRRDLRSLPTVGRRRFDLVCANLTCDLLLACREAILGRLAQGGSLVLAGLLRSQFPEVEAAYRRAGLRLKTRRRENEWESGAFFAGL